MFAVVSITLDGVMKINKKISFYTVLAMSAKFLDTLSQCGKTSSVDYLPVDKTFPQLGRII
jgi:hypothetical protein